MNIKSNQKTYGLKLNQLFQCLLLILTLSACSSLARPSVQPGTIPQGKPINQQAVQQGQQVRAALLKQFPEDRDPKKQERVSRIVKRLAHAAEGNAASNPWQITILKADNIKNAAATSGNFVFIWTGILQAVNDDHELSTVLGHELAHVLALHTEPTFAEQISGVVASGVQIATQTALMSQGVVGQGAAAAGSISSGLVKALLVNPYSQKMELEADQIGLFMMAKAGYNPKAAINFWKRLSQDPNFTSSSLSFLSTHPTSEQRIQKLSEFLPEAEVLYQNSRQDSFSVRKKPKAPIASNGSSNSAQAKAPQVSSATSFSTSTSAPSASVLSKSTDNSVSPLDRWTTREICFVYERADESSTKTIELAAGVEVIIKHELKDWVEIKAPVTGFILKSQVKAAWSKR